MSGRILSREEVLALESEIDHNYASTPLPDLEYFKAVWTTLSVIENQFRTLTDLQPFLKIRDKLSDDLRSGAHLDFKVAHMLDSTKFALHQALKAFRSRLRQSTQRVRYTFDSDGETVLKFVKSSEEYAEATRKFLSYHRGVSPVVCHDDDHTIEFVESSESRPYSVLEDLCWGEWNRSAEYDSKQTGIDVLITELNRHKGTDSFLVTIGKKTKLSDGKLAYTCIANIAKRLQVLLKDRNRLIPDSWKFPWATAADTLRCYRALCTRSIYHMLAVHYHAQRNRLRKGGINDACLVLETSTLIDDLSRISGLDRRTVEAVVYALTYGTGMKNPDPALQPIIPVGSGTIATPAYQIASSNYERNLLSLHARVDPDTFNSSSSIFEEMMTDELVGPLRDRFSIVKVDFRVPDGASGEQVDIVVADVGSRTIIFLELRWMLSPGDADEVIKRIKACGEKVNQLGRKLKAARSHLSELIRKLELNDPSNWSVSGLVVINGFGGAPPEAGSGIPSVPQPVFLAALTNLREARDIQRYFLSADWLPQEGRDFGLRTGRLTLLGCTMRGAYLSIGPKKYLKETIPQTAMNFSNAT
jgi:hypothetical protein